MLLAEIPSPTRSVWHLGPIPVRAYALCIIVGIVVAVWLCARRWKERGGEPDHVWDVAGWAIVFGIIGGRLYNLVSDPEEYFLGRPGTSPIDALKIWDGGLGIWGAIALGFLGAYIGCRRRGIDIRVFADAAAPGVIFAQALGRLGNYFNNELYGGPTSVPWGLQIHCLNNDRSAEVIGGIASGGEACPAHSAVLASLYQPTFLYELIWDVAIGLLLLYIDRRLRLGRGNVMALYVMGYTAGRGWIEALRTDHANHILGLRLNDWTAMIVFVLGLWYFLKHDGFHARRESSPYYAKREGSAADPPEPPGDAPAGSEPTGSGPSGSAPTGSTAVADDPPGGEPADVGPAGADASGWDEVSADVRRDET